MTTRIRALAIGGALSATLSACGGGGGPPGDVVAPAVTTASPGAGAREVLVGAQATVTFSEPVDAATVSAATIRLEGLDGTAVPASVSCAGEVATLAPAAPLSPATEYRLRVTTGVHDLAGNAVATDWTATFATAHWAPTPGAGAPTARSGATAVWTGKELVVWGGTPATRAGGRYDPAARVWRAMSVDGAPAARTGHTAVWTGQEMIVWGGSAGANGGRYDPAADTWRPVTTTGAPPGCVGHSAVAAGGKMIVWGGTYDGTGAIYDPAADAWTATSVPAAFRGRRDHGAVWTGSRMIVWGGYDLPPPSGGAGIVYDHALDTGAAYDPATDAWTLLPTTLAPAARWSPRLALGGGRVFVWGGVSGALLTGNTSTAAYYDLVSGAWVQVADAGRPSAGADAYLAWTGTRLLAWSADAPAGGAAYDPATDAWSAMPSAGAPGARSGSVAAWTGDALVVWGGASDASGAAFTP